MRYAVAAAAAEELLAFSVTPSGEGALVFTTAGGVIAVGDAVAVGDLKGVQLNSPLVSAVADPDGGGYWLVAADGGVFAFDAEFFGSVPQLVPDGVVAEEWLNAAVVGLAPTASGGGYWLTAADGGVFSFGDAQFRGSLPLVLPGVTLNGPVTDVVGVGAGYVLVAEDGGVFNFSDTPFHGSLGGNPPTEPVVAITPIPVG